MSSGEFHFQRNDTTLLFTIKADGTIERGPAFTTTDEMSLEFWRAVERLGKPHDDLLTLV